MGQLAAELQVADSDVRGPHLPHLPICLGDRIVHRHRPDGAPDKRGMVLEVHDSEEHEGGPKSFSVRWDNNTYSDGHTDDDVERIIYSHELQDRTFQQRWCTVVQVGPIFAFCCVMGLFTGVFLGWDWDGGGPIKRSWDPVQAP